MRSSDLTPSRFASRISTTELSTGGYASRENAMKLEFANITWTGPEADDMPLLHDLPDELCGLLNQEISGFIQFDGGLHLRGACEAPGWHSLRAAWKGKSALHHTYSAMRPDDIPFAQDYLGNQFFLRSGKVMRIAGETGRLEPPLRGLVSIDKDVNTDTIQLPLVAFLMLVQENPDSLSLKLLEAFKNTGQSLAPGQLLHVYPPLCSKEARSGIGLKLVALDAGERLSFLAKAVARVSSLRAGEDISFPLLR